ILGPWGEKQALFPPLDVPREESDEPDYPSPEQNEILLHPRVQQFGSAVYVRLNVSRMKAISVASEERPHMNVDGYGLPSVLAWMKGAEEERLAEITANARKIVPGIRRIKTLRKFVRSQRMDSLDVAGQKVWRPVNEERLGDRFEVEFDNGASVPADLLSEGTVVALGLLATLASKNRPRLILADDIDRGLHVEAQSKLVDVMRELLATDPDLQIVCTTHSPYLLDRFKPDEVRVLSLDSSRHTHARALTDHPDFEKWKFGNQTGELWAALGDAWVASE
ncbi:MAG TPA: ATP-binding protein, partial [Polyangiaceae bacterium]|nr:ATP-binding protein [Polyangiaceae bacterium]